MSTITLELPAELAARLPANTAEIAEALEIGLREVQAREAPGFTGASDILDLLARLPSPEEILALRPSVQFQARVEELLEKSRSGTALTADEEREWRHYEFIEHLVRLAKTRARTSLQLS